MPMSERPRYQGVKCTRQHPDPDGTAQAGLDSIPEKQWKDDDLIRVRGVEVSRLRCGIERGEIVLLSLALRDPRFLLSRVPSVRQRI